MHRLFRFPEKSTIIQIFGISLFLLAGTGLYFHFQSKAGSTLEDADAQPSFSAPLTHTLELEKGTGQATFTRADGADRRATVTDHEGRIIPVKNGEARFEGARRVENLLTYSEDFSNAVWSKSNVTIIENSVVAPDGSMTADTVMATGGIPTILQNVGVSAIRVLTYSVYAKAYTVSSIRLLLSSAGNGYAITFNLSAGTSGTPVILGTGGNVSVLGSGIQNVGNG